MIGPPRLKGEVNVVSSGRHAIVSLLFLVSTIVSAHAQSTVDKSATSTISGKVIVGGKGVPGVVVGLVVSEQYRSNPQPTRFRAKTDEEGNYRITKVAPGTYVVIAAAPAYVASEGRKSLIIGKNEVIENIDITLLRGGVITGKVTDADGNPLSEESVALSQASDRGGYYFRNIRTDDRGIYRAFGIPAGRYLVSVGRDAKSSFGNRSRRGAQQQTFHPSATDAAAATAIEVSEGSEATDVDITLGRLTRKYSVSGRIIDSDTSQPVPKANVGLQLFFENGSSSHDAVAVTNKDGVFKIENLSPAKYSVYLDSSPDSELHSEAVRFDVIDQDVEGLLITTAKRASLSGVVVLEGADNPKVRENLARGRVTVHVGSDYVGRLNPSGSIKPDGTFRVTGLSAGRFMLNVQTPDQLRPIRLERNGVVFPGWLEVKDREQITGLRLVVGLANGKIRGMLERPEGLALPASARIFVAVRRIEDTPGSYVSPVQPDARGQFLVEGLIAGTYEISVNVFVDSSPSRRMPIPRTTVAVTNGAVTEVTITLQMPKTAPGGP